jgi:hypothetical protein
MKQYLLILFVLIATGCAHGPEYPLPETPEFSTTGGRNCATKCRQIHNKCESGCQESKEAQLACVSDCNQKLDQCYQHCKELLE